MPRTVILSSPGMQQMLNEGWVRSALTPYAERVLAAAQADPHDETGEYESGLMIEQATTDRAVVRVVATDWKSHILEANFGILARALSGGAG